MKKVVEVEVPDVPEVTESVAPVADYVHGTTAGYERHKKAGERPCEPCREARRAYDREYTKRRKAEKATMSPNLKALVDEVRAASAPDPVAEPSEQEQLEEDLQTPSEALKFWKSAAHAYLARIRMLERDLRESDQSLREQVQLVLKLREQLLDAAAAANSAAYEVKAGQSVTITVEVGA